jgi:hypothetical protein
MRLHRRLLILTVLGIVLLAVAGVVYFNFQHSLPTAPVTLQAAPVPLPDGNGGIGFDDLQYAATLGRVIVPAGRTGNLDLLDPNTRQVTPIPGFSTDAKFAGGHGEGTTSADAGNGLLFAIDRTAMKLDVVDPGKRAIVGSAPLAASPDYVRFVEPTNEIWVTEPDLGARIEVFKLSKDFVPVPSGFITVVGGPESLVIDAKRGRAYTHLWVAGTVAIDLKSHAIIGQWLNGCVGSRGIALDEARGFLLVGCSEGKAVVLDVEHGGKQLSSFSFGDGVDVISYNAQLGHLYLPASSSAKMAILSVSNQGQLSLLATVDTAKGAHCVTADDQGNAWVCDPSRGQLLLVKDTLPAMMQ